MDTVSDSSFFPQDAALLEWEKSLISTWMKRAASCHSATLVPPTCRAAAGCGSFQLQNGFLRDSKSLCKFASPALGLGRDKHRLGCSTSTRALHGECSSVLAGPAPSPTVNTKRNLGQLWHQHSVIAEQKDQWWDQCHPDTAHAQWAPLDPPWDLAWSIDQIQGDNMRRWTFWGCFLSQQAHSFSIYPNSNNK